MAQLVFQTAFPGDLFLSIPLLRRLRAWAPHESIVLACRPGLGDFFQREKLVDEVIEVNKSSAESRHTVQRRLRERDWTTVFCPHQSLRTQSWMHGVRAKNGKVGFSSLTHFLSFEHRVRRRSEWPDALRQLNLLTVFDPELKRNMKELEVSKAQDNIEDRVHALDFSEKPLPAWASMTLRKNPGGSKRVCLAPGSVWATKRWTLQGYIELGKVLSQRGYEVVLVGSPAERALCAEIASQIPGAKNRGGETSLSQMVDLFSESRALVTNDSGAMHMAAVADLPTVAVFGPTTLTLGYRPWQNRAIVVQTDIPCRPCGKHGANVCPVGNHRCMTDVAAIQVLAALQKFL